MLKGAVKVIHVVSGKSSIDVIAKHDTFITNPYAASMSAMNIVTSKFSGLNREQGMLFLGIALVLWLLICTKEIDPITNEINANMVPTDSKSERHAPRFEREFMLEESAKEVLPVVNRSSIGRGDASQFLTNLEINSGYRVLAD
ncbi:hypothetical protein EDB81DRAFT_888825 [Dactylonectria macrodidyma]|uniref:Uncharacterized protein n=1 Tax=Dactylonectria macrodidyma TaxID=307937 RepID=A0A9P9E1U0_9HYPO|nr:hypothetical protein EDB81DRAFT_888825 [Dactylonectria macrodidyma]